MHLDTLKSGFVPPESKLVPWNQWNPGLTNDELTLGQVKETLPGANPDDIGFMVKLLENPASPLALTGAVSLERHDCIHIILGRGLLNQDEAFVIGFTMGSAGDDLSKLEEFIFKKVARHLYPTNYRMTRKSLKAYQLGLEAAREMGTYKIYNFPFENYYHMQLSELRKMLKVNAARLKQIYREEQAMLPDTKASKRLPII
ncbi:MAG: hypothetical protein EB060_01580 [Proteobacteria bacterium]|nr:hypothetical protein [Pseudomonadota bacterium]